MIVDRIYTPGLAQVAYLVADEAAGVVAVIDPRRDVAPYLEWATAHGVRIGAVLETHVHADFVSGARDLAAATGATIFTSRLGAQAFPHQALDDGDEVAVGRLRLRALWTPGHTPEHIGFLLFDPEQGAEPLAFFSGDVLFPGEIGRPDLLGPARTKELVEQLYDTVEQRLKPLPDTVIVYPGHTAGSPCGKRIGDAPQSTMGEEKRRNYAFQTRDRDEFTRVVMAGMPKPPAYYPVMKQVNKVGADLIQALPAGAALSPDEVAARQAQGALVIDARPSAAFAAGHLPGAVAVGLGPSFAIWAGWLTPYDRDVILVLEDDARFDEARTELWRIGIDRVAGYLAGGIEAWRASGHHTADLPSLAVNDLARALADASDTVVLDVRDDAEWDEGHIPGALHGFVGDIAQGAMPDLPAGKRIAVICGSGYRSTVAASLLQGQGVSNLINVQGGMGAWAEAGLPVVRDDPALEPEVSVATFVAEGGAAAAQVVDVREPNEWSTGRLPRALLIPLDDLGARHRELDPRRPVVTVCRSGRRSLAAAHQLRAAGFPQARSLAGGIIAWHDAGLPIER